MPPPSTEEPAEDDRTYEERELGRMAGEDRTRSGELVLEDVRSSECDCEPGCRGEGGHTQEDPWVQLGSRCDDRTDHPGEEDDGADAGVATPSVLAFGHEEAADRRVRAAREVLEGPEDDPSAPQSDGERDRDEYDS